jgi:hypothetical protein
VTSIPKATVPKYTRFNQQAAQEIMRHHTGPLGYARRHRGLCEVGILETIGGSRALGTGATYRQALAAAGVYFTSIDTKAFNHEHH